MKKPGKSGQRSGRLVGQQGTFERLDAILEQQFALFHAPHDEIITTGMGSHARNGFVQVVMLQAQLAELTQQDTRIERGIFGGLSHVERLKRGGQDSGW